MMTIKRDDVSSSGNFAFYLEVLLILIALLLISTVLVSVFAKARLSSTTASQKTEEVTIARDVAETFAASTDDDDFVSRLSGLDGFMDVRTDGGVIEAGYDAYTVKVELSEKSASAGILHGAAITVTSTDGTTIDLSTTRYGSGRTSASSEGGDAS